MAEAVDPCGQRGEGVRQERPRGATRRDTGRAMSEESTTPDLVELLRRCFEAISAGDLDEAQRFLTHDAVLDMTRTTGVVVHGRDAIRAFQEDWLARAGSGVAFVRVLQTARPTGTTGHVTQWEPNVWITEDGRVVRVIVYPNSELDEARAAAERLAQERG